LRLAWTLFWLSVSATFAWIRASNRAPLIAIESARSASVEAAGSSAQRHNELVLADIRPHTGRGLKILDSCSRATALYGNPDSRSPSTRNGQRLELLYYAFDWAGADVPQVLDVLCTAGENTKPGRVVEITLAASSL
jgi:hypothetical protein